MDDINIDEKEDFSCTRSFEVSTGTGQLISGMCLPDSTEIIKQAMKHVKNIELPVTNQILLAHGGYGRFTRFQIEQHKYAGGGHGGCGGYVEVLEIKNPPDGRRGIVVISYDTEKGCVFYEFETLEYALEAWKKSIYKFDDAVGCLRTVVCGELDPWFYAVANQALWKDFAYPNWLCDDPLYRPGKWFIVKEEFSEIEELKMCMGMHKITHREKEYRVVWWNDGSVSKETQINFEKNIRPMEMEDLWKQEAYTFIKKILNGIVDSLEIETADGRIVTIKTEERTNRRNLETGRGPQKTLFGQDRVEAIIRTGKKTIVVGKKTAMNFEKEETVKREKNDKCKNEGDEDY